MELVIKLSNSEVNCKRSGEQKRAGVATAVLLFLQVLR